MDLPWTSRYFTCLILRALRLLACVQPSRLRPLNKMKNCMDGWICVFSVRTVRSG